MDIRSSIGYDASGAPEAPTPRGNRGSNQQKDEPQATFAQTIAAKASEAAAKPKSENASNGEPATAKAPIGAFAAAAQITTAVISTSEQPAQIAAPATAAKTEGAGLAAQAGQAPQKAANPGPSFPPAQVGASHLDTLFAAPDKALATPATPAIGSPTMETESLEGLSGRRAKRADAAAEIAFARAGAPQQASAKTTKAALAPASAPSAVSAKRGDGYELRLAANEPSQLIGDRPAQATLAPTASPGAPLAALAANAAPSAHAAQGPSHAPPPTINAQIAERLIDGARNGAQRIAFQLHPADMGKVDIRLSMTEAGLRAVIAVEHPGALEALRQNASALQQSLTAAGIDAENWSLTFENHDRSQHGPNDRRDSEPDRPASDAPAPLASDSPGNNEPHTNENGALSIRV